MGSYFFYMGGAPSISRAWIATLLYLIGMAFNLKAHPLNTLGVALGAALLIDPLIAMHIGFQLSFSATLGILLFYFPFEKQLERLLPKRPYKELRQMTFLSQCGYLLCYYLRKVLALQGAALIFTLPLLLFHFGSYPLVSIIYNLFYPLLFSCLLALFLLHLDFLTAPFASFMLMLVEGAPKKLLFKLTPLSILLFSAPLLFTVMKRCINHLRQLQQQKKDRLTTQSATAERLE